MTLILLITITIKRVKCHFLLMDNTQLFEGYSFEFVEISNHLIGVQGGDSGGKSVSRCDPAESKANEEAHGPRGKRPPVTEIHNLI